MAGTWHGSCTQVGAYPAGSPSDLACSPSGVISFYQVSYAASTNSWSYPIGGNSTQGGVLYTLPVDGRENQAVSVLGNGEFSTADQPCFHIDLQGNYYTEYGQYFLSNYSGTPTCASDPSNPLPFCEDGVFSYICRAWKVAEAPAPAPGSSASALSVAPLALVLAALLALVGF